jgi:hypothetical protein
VTDPPSSAKDDLRASRRVRTLAKAKIFYGPHLHEANCTITDRSDGGARVRLAPGSYVPGEVWLLEIRAGLVHRSEVAWRSYPLVGLRFLQTTPAEACDTADRRIFNRAWQASRF